MTMPPMSLTGCGVTALMYPRVAVAASLILATAASLACSAFGGGYGGLPCAARTRRARSTPSPHRATSGADRWWLRCWSRPYISTPRRGYAAPSSFPCLVCSGPALFTERPAVEGGGIRSCRCGLSVRCTLGSVQRRYGPCLCRCSHDSGRPPWWTPCWLPPSARLRSSERSRRRSQASLRNPL